MLLYSACPLKYAACVLRHGLLLLLLVLLADAGARAQAPAWQLAMAASQTATSRSQVFESAVDGNGNLFLTGPFRGTVTFGNTTLTSTGGSEDLFVAKWSPATGNFVWAQSAGSPSDDDVYAVAVSGNSIYITGGFTTGPARFGNTALTSVNSLGSGFVAKLTDNGTTGSFEWAQVLGGPAAWVAVNGTNVYVVGSFSGRGISFGSITLNSSGYLDIYLAKLADAGGSANVTWALRAGGIADDVSYCVALSGSSVYVAGTFQSPSMSFGSTTLALGANSDIFVAKAVDAGSSASFTWALRAGGNGDDEAHIVTADGNSLYMGGHIGAGPATFGSTVLPGAPAASTLSNAFVTRIKDAGAAASFVWAQQVGGSGKSTCWGVKSIGTKVYLAGSFSDTATFGGSSITTAPGSPLLAADVFAARLSDAGTTASFDWARPGGGTGTDLGYALSISGAQVYVGGAVSPPAAFGSYTVAGTSGLALAAVASFTVASTTATIPALAGGIGLYPNPARGRVWVQLPEPTGPVTLSVRDALGRPVRIQPATGSRTELDLSGLVPGLYAVRVQAGVATATRRLVVE